MTSTRSTLLVVLALAGLVSAACGGRPLENLGDISDRVVYGEEGAATTIPVDELGEPVLPVVDSDELDWMNVQLASLGDGGQLAVTSLVWERSDGVNRWVQASPDEIAAALPGIQFPAVAPEGTVMVTSQLVFDLGLGTVDPAESAAFGFWRDEPYTLPREVSQLAVLRVGQTIASGTVTPGITSAFDAEGLALEWTAGDYRYRLLCRNAVPDSTCSRMAEELEPLFRHRTFGTGAVVPGTVDAEPTT
jgi:hypothetical protein